MEFTNDHSEGQQPLLPLRFGVWALRLECLCLLLRLAKSLDINVRSCALFDIKLTPDSNTIPVRFVIQILPVFICGSLLSSPSCTFCHWVCIPGLGQPFYVSQCRQNKGYCVQYHIWSVLCVRSYYRDTLNSQIHVMYILWQTQCSAANMFIVYFVLSEWPLILFGPQFDLRTEFI